MINLSQPYIQTRRRPMAYLYVSLTFLVMREAWTFERTGKYKYSWIPTPTLIQVAPRYPPQAHGDHTGIREI